MVSVKSVKHVYLHCLYGPLEMYWGGFACLGSASAIHNAETLCFLASLCASFWTSSARLLATMKVRVVDALDYVPSTECILRSSTEPVRALAVLGCA